MATCNTMKIISKMTAIQRRPVLIFLSTFALLQKLAFWLAFFWLRCAIDGAILELILNAGLRGGL